MTIINADCLEEMKKMADNSISAIVTDPPYGLKFMGKDWDNGIPGIPFWKEALRICKPGSFLLSFGGTRTFHRLTCAIEDAGWEIRDCLTWLYGSGFPKSHNHFGLEGYGTALKPAWEPIIMAMKPCDGTFKQNVEKWGQGGINIDECRIGKDKIKTNAKIKGQSFTHLGNGEGFNGCAESVHIGRWPANLLLDEEAATVLGDPARFFYCAKASSKERNEGLEKLSNVQCQTGCSGAMPIDDLGNERDRFKKICKNFHPTVKPLKLMEYLIKLVMPPKDGVLLDPFAGSGTTILAAQNLGVNAIGIEMSKEYCDIANARNANQQMPTKQLPSGMK